MDQWICLSEHLSSCLLAKAMLSKTDVSVSFLSSLRERQQYIRKSPWWTRVIFFSSRMFLCQMWFNWNHCTIRQLLGVSYFLALSHQQKCVCLLLFSFFACFLSLTVVTGTFILPLSLFSSKWRRERECNTCCLFCSLLHYISQLSALAFFSAQLQLKVDQVDEEVNGKKDCSFNLTSLCAS